MPTYIALSSVFNAREFEVFVTAESCAHAVVDPSADMHLLWVREGSDSRGGHSIRCCRCASQEASVWRLSNASLTDVPCSWR